MTPPWILPLLAAASPYTPTSKGRSRSALSALTATVTAGPGNVVVRRHEATETGRPARRRLRQSFVQAPRAATRLPVGSPPHQGRDGRAGCARRLFRRVLLS